MLNETPFKEDDSLVNATGTGFVMGGLIGVATGVASAIALPLYVGYKIVDYVCDKIDINSASSTCLDVAGAVGTLALTIDYSLPAFSIAGLVIGGAIGAVTGRTVGHGVKGIEKIVG